MSTPAIVRNHSQSLVEAGFSGARHAATAPSLSEPHPPTMAGHTPGLRQASKAYSTPMAARNNDVKYKAKYKELKKKVKDIEQDNERLQVHLLRTKKNIQRLRLERAILYERLANLGHQVPSGGSPPYPQVNNHTRPSYDSSAKDDTGDSPAVEQPAALRDPHAHHPRLKHSISHPTPPDHIGQ